MKINSNWIFNWNLYTSRKFRVRLSSEDKKTNTDDIPTNKNTKGITEKDQKPTMFGPLALGLQQPNDGCPKSHEEFMEMLNDIQQIVVKQNVEKLEGI